MPDAPAVTHSRPPFFPFPRAPFPFLPPMRSRSAPSGSAPQPLARNRSHFIAGAGANRGLSAPPLRVRPPLRDCIAGRLLPCAGWKGGCLCSHGAGAGILCESLSKTDKKLPETAKNGQNLPLPIDGGWQKTQ